MDNPNNGANTGYNGQGEYFDQWGHLGPTLDERLDSIPGLREAQKAKEFLRLNDFSETQAYKILNTGTSRLNGQFELAKHQMSHAEQHSGKDTGPYGLARKRLELMSEYDYVKDGNELIGLALESLETEEGIDIGLARQILEDCRDRSGKYDANLANHSEANPEAVF